MPKIDAFDNHNAADDLFFSEKFGDDSMWSLDPKSDGVSGGTPSYTVLASNISKDEADMKPYRPTSIDVPLAEPVDSESFRFEFFGIKYLANGATGTLDFYIKKKLDR